MKKSDIKMAKESCMYRKSLENLIRTGKQDELFKKIRCFHRDGKVFYSCCSEKKLAFLIPTKVEMVYCYTIIIL